MGDAGGPAWALAALPMAAPTAAPKERGHEAVIKETQAMLSGLLGGSTDMADSLDEMKAEYDGALLREAAAWGEVERLQAELRVRDAAPAPGAAEQAHLSRWIENHEGRTASALSVLDAALEAATRRAASDAAAVEGRAASEAQAGAREVALVARAEQGERERDDARAERDSGRAREERDRAGGGAREEDLRGRADAATAALAVANEALDQSGEREGHARERADAAEVAAEAANDELDAMRAREEQWQEQIEEAVAARLQAERRSAGAADRIAAAMSMYEEVAGKVAVAERQREEETHRREQETLRAQLAEDHAKTAKQTASHAERLRSDAEAKAGQAAKGRDDALEYARLEGEARHSLQDHVEQLTREREMLHSRLSIQAGEVAATNEAWDSKWNEENWNRQLSEKELQAAIRSGKKLELEAQNLRLDNHALREAVQELKNSLGVAATIGKIRKGDVPKGEKGIGFDGVLSRMGNIKKFVDNIESSQASRKK